MEHIRVEASYLRPVFFVKSFKATVDRAVNALKLFDAQTPFDTIAFCGMSGASLAYPLSYLMGKNLICVRKTEKIENHSWRESEGVVDCKSYVIVDDCVDSGDTLRKIEKGVKSHCKGYSEEPKLVGIHLFLTANVTTGKEDNLTLKKFKESGVKIISAPFEFGYL